MLRIDGTFYSVLKKSRNYSVEVAGCIESTVNHLLDGDTTAGRPGMLLGKVQSGKTEAFLGVIGLAFDNGFDVAIVLTKGTKALTEQTYERVCKTYDGFRMQELLQVHDIMSMPALIGYELDQKLVVVAKKQKDNLRRLATALFDRHPEMGRKRVLIIDDEADYASIGFRLTEDERVEMNKIARQIDEIRARLDRCDFLQVTATPYSLYLQPPGSVESDSAYEFEPTHPAFTVLVPEMPSYVGGDQYFGEGEANGRDSGLFQPVSQEELEVLHHQDRRRLKLEDALTSNGIAGMRSAVVNFVVGACIRRVQDSTASPRERKYSFIIHTESAKRCHEWQKDIVMAIVGQLVEEARTQSPLFTLLVSGGYAGLRSSVSRWGLECPALDAVTAEVRDVLLKGWLLVSVVNSDRQVKELLDEQGQLRLRAPLNIFVGGQILDRGVTIAKLIGFYYGRRANRAQQDTVLQHSRMYGPHPPADLAVTRFYTTQEIYGVLRTINEFDSTLRGAFRRGANERGIVFIRKDERNRIIPCSPNKILLSSVTSLRPSKRLLPIGFRTRPKHTTEPIVTKIDRELARIVADDERPPSVLITLDAARHIVDLIWETLEFDIGFDHDCEALVPSMEYLSLNATDQPNRGKVLCLVRRNRDLARMTGDEPPKYSDNPDTAHIEGEIAKREATALPMLMLFRQNGRKERGWNDCPFWWPVLYAPRDAKPVVFSSGVNEPRIAGID